MYHKLQLDITKKIGNKDGEGNAYGNLGLAYLSMGDLQNAIKFHEKKN